MVLKRKFNLNNEVWDETIEKVLILTDDKGSIKLAENPFFHKQTKHIDIKHYFIRESLKYGQFDVNWVPT